MLLGRIPPTPADPSAANPRGLQTASLPEAAHLAYKIEWGSIAVRTAGGLGKRQEEAAGRCGRFLRR